MHAAYYRDAFHAGHRCAYTGGERHPFMTGAAPGGMVIYGGL